MSVRVKAPVADICIWCKVNELTEKDEGKICNECSVDRREPQHLVDNRDVCDVCGEHSLENDDGLICKACIGFYAGTSRGRRRNHNSEGFVPINRSLVPVHRPAALPAKSELPPRFHEHASGVLSYGIFNE